jgi:hypothetical protein
VISLNFHPEAQLKFFRCEKIDLLAAGLAPQRIEEGSEVSIAGQF